jgi:hypothetical protein
VARYFFGTAASPAGVKICTDDPLVQHNQISAFRPLYPFIHRLVVPAHGAVRLVGKLLADIEVVRQRIAFEFFPEPLWPPALLDRVASRRRSILIRHSSSDQLSIYSIYDAVFNVNSSHTSVAGMK